jgi:predicted transcriptional regulator
MATTIQLEEKTKSRLNDLKNYPKESFDQVVSRLIAMVREESKLSDETIKNIKESLDEIKSGDYYTHEQVKAELGIK